MKKLLTIVAVLVLAASSMSARDGRFGIVAGFNSSQMKLANFDFKSAVGYQAGITYNQPLILGFSLQPELLYNVKGTTWSEIKANMGYVEAGAQVQWGTDLQLVKVYGFAEPFLGYAVNGKVSYSSFAKDLNMDNIKNRLELGLGVGAGVELLQRIQVSFKYYWNMESNDLADYIKEVTASVKDGRSFNGLVFSAALFF